MGLRRFVNSIIAEMRTLPRGRAQVTLASALLVATLGGAWLAGGPGAIIVTAAGFALVFVCAVALAHPGDLGRVTGGATALLAIHLVLTNLLHVYLRERTPGGSMFEDDLGYVTMAALIARIWSGTSVPFPVDPSVVNTYVLSASGLFWLLGPNVAALKLANTVLAVLAGLMGYRTALLIGGRRAGLIALAALLIWPSLGLWSALTLKEAFSFICTMGITWSVLELVRTRALVWTLPIVAFALPLQDTRAYLFTLLVALWPITLAVLWVVRRMVPLSHVAVAGIAAFVLIANIRPGLGVGVQTVSSLDDVRAGMAEGARSAIVESTRSVTATDGQCFTVSLVGARAGPQGTPDLHVVPTGTTFVYAERATTEIRPPEGSVAVRDGDVVCIGSAPAAVVAPTQRTPGGSTSPSPTATAFPQIFVSSTGSTRVNDAASTELSPGDDVRRSLSHFPRGALLLIGAPFPWDLVAPSRWILIPEMLLWYPTVLAALVGLGLLWTRRTWSALYVVLVGLGIAGILSLAEGNLGTLVRHRGMVIPFAVIIASCAAAAVLPGALQTGQLLRLGRSPRDRDHASAAEGPASER